MTLKDNKGGKRKRGGGKKPFVVRGRLSVGDDTILFDGDLIYTGKDEALNPAQRAAMDAWEAKRYKNKIEYGTAVDENGDLYGEKKGGKGSVNTPWTWHMVEDSAFSHNHPREDGMLGGTFSIQDLNVWTRYAQKTMRATAKEGTYSITKGPKFDRRGFSAYYSNAHDKRDNELGERMKNLRTDVRNGKIDYGEYSKQYYRAFNSFLIGLHNDLLAGQKTYGYKYHLEERNGVNLLGYGR